MPQRREKYTKPKLRDEIKDDLKRSDKGGKPGRWSARKSQILVKTYEAKGGGYTSETKDEAARSLERWTDQDWQTIDGDGDARKQGRTGRYLPKKVWEALSDSEKREAERTKTTQDLQGKRKVPWTPAIKRAFERLKSERAPSSSSSTRQQLYDQAARLGIAGRSRMTKAQLRQAIERAD